MSRARAVSLDVEELVVFGELLGLGLVLLAVARVSPPAEARRLRRLVHLGLGAAGLLDSPKKGMKP